MANVDPNSTNEDLLVYPTNKVVGIIDNSAKTEAAIDALAKAGFDTDEIEVFCGQKGANIVDSGGEEHGVLAKILRTIQTFGTDYEHAKRHEEELQAGHFMITVPVDEDEDKQEAADILKANGGYFINYYGALTIEEIWS